MSFLDRYKHYDPSEGPGSPDEWARLADLLADQIIGDWSANTKAKAGSKRTKKVNPDLALMMLETMPETLGQLKLAYRNCLFVYHPDYGGTNEKCRLLIEAYQRLLRRFA